MESVSYGASESKSQGVKESVSNRESVSEVSNPEGQ